MATFFLTSSLMITAVLLARFLLKNKVSFLILYPLWGIVLLRLLVPFTIIESPASIMNIVHIFTENYQGNNKGTATVQENLADINISTQENNKNNNKTSAMENNKNTQKTNIEKNNIKTNSNDKNNFSGNDTGNSLENNKEDQVKNPVKSFSTKENLDKIIIKSSIIIWITGSIIFFASVIISNKIFYKKLKKQRIKAKTGISGDNKIPVYKTGIIDTPCLAGVLKPAVYIPIYNDIKNQDCSKIYEKYLTQILAHEYMHVKHKDNIWALLRTICLGLYWFNPFVWIAAHYSKQDAELACDEAVLNGCTDEERYNYGNMLLDTGRKQWQKGLCIATPLYSNKKNLKERIIMVTQKRNPKKWHIVFITLFSLILAGCNMTKEKTGVSHAKDNQAASAEPASADNTAVAGNEKGDIDVTEKEKTNTSHVNPSEDKRVKALEEFARDGIKSRPEWSKWFKKHKTGTDSLYFSILYNTDAVPLLLISDSIIGGSPKGETTSAYVYYYNETEYKTDLLTLLEGHGSSDPLSEKNGYFVISSHHSLRVYDYDKDFNTLSAQDVYGYFLYDDSTPDKDKKYIYSTLSWNVPFNFDNEKTELDARENYMYDKMDEYAEKSHITRNFAPEKAETFYNKYGNANPIQFIKNTKKMWKKFYSDGAIEGNLYRIVWYGEENEIIYNAVTNLKESDFTKASEKTSILLSPLNRLSAIDDDETLYFLNSGYTSRAFIIKKGEENYSSYSVYTLDSSKWSEKDKFADLVSSAYSPDILNSLQISGLYKADYDNDGDMEIAFTMIENPFALNSCETLYMFDENGFMDYNLFSFTKDDYRYLTEQICKNYDNYAKENAGHTTPDADYNFFKDIKKQPKGYKYKSEINTVPSDELDGYNFTLTGKDLANNYEFGSKIHYDITPGDDKPEIKTVFTITFNKKDQEAKQEMEIGAVVNYKGNGKFTLNNNSYAFNLN